MVAAYQASEAAGTHKSTGGCPENAAFLRNGIRILKNNSKRFLLRRNDRKSKISDFGTASFV